MKQENRNYSSLKELSRRLGADLFGVADISGLKREFLLSPEMFKNLNRGISLGVRLLDSVLEEIQDKPTKLYYHHYRQANFFLDRLAFKLASFIQSEGFLSLPIPASQVIDWEKQKGHLSHRKIAYAAGLGWLGRNKLLVNPDFGSRIRLVTILTNMPLSCDEPLNRDCGECRACISVCPAGAIKEKREDFDRVQCFEQLRAFTKMRLVGQYICGVCVKACKGKKNLTF